MKIKRNAKRKQIRKKGAIRSPLLDWGSVSRKDTTSLAVIVAVIFCLTILIVVGFWLAKNKKSDEANTYAYFRTVTPLEKKIRTLVKGYPIEKMAPYIAQQEPKVASLLVGIAKKESAWGKRKPVLEGQDCYNYWGFRQERERMGSGGHTCFDSPAEAVQAVSERLAHLVNDEQMDTPVKLIVWKCGYECLNREKTASEQKWIRDVNVYYEKMMQ